MTTPKSPRTPCSCCRGALDLLQAACKTPWTPEERAAAVVRAQESLRETAPMLADWQRSNHLQQFGAKSLT